MQEDKENTDWTDKTDSEQENREESSLQGSPVGKLITHNLLWHIPSQEQTGDERPQRHEQLGSKVVTIAQEILAEEAQIRYGTLRERTEYSYDAANDGLEPGSLGTAYLTEAVDYAMAWNDARLRIDVQGVSHYAGHPRIADQKRDLSIGCDKAARDLAYNIVNAGKGILLFHSIFSFCALPRIEEKRPLSFMVS